MAGTRTAPAYDGTPTSRAITLHVMDVSGDTFTQRLVVAISATIAAIEAWIAAYQAATNATVFRVTEELVYNGDADPDNAVSAYRAGVENGINLLFKEPVTQLTFGVRIVAPVPAALQGAQDIPLLSDTAPTNVILTTLALATDYEMASSQYTSRRERSNNPRVK